MKYQMPDQRGYTVLELLLSMGLFSIFLGILFVIFVSFLDVQIEAEARSPVEEDSRFILTRLSYDISRAQRIDLPATIGQQSTSLTLTIDGTAYVYDVQDGKLTLTAGADPQALTSFGTRMGALSFERMGNAGGKHAVRMSFTITSTTSRGFGPETKTVETTIGGR